MKVMKKIGSIIGRFFAIVFFIMCVVVSAPFVIVKAAIASFNEYLTKLCDKYNGVKK